MTDNIIPLPQQPEPNWIIGPFTVNRVVLEGRLIPNLQAIKGESETSLLLDERFILVVPNPLAYQVADFVANAMAIASGYPSFKSESKEMPFAPKMEKL